MRIVGGKHKGRKLLSPKDYEIRPTADNVREALFNIMGNINGLTFLDMFTGSGAVGLEALSRGAKVTINDRSRTSLELAKKNFALCKEECIRYQLDALTLIDRLKNVFDIIFMDPPYALDCQGVLTALAKSAIIDNNTLIVYEKSKDAPDPQIDLLECVDRRRYGIVCLMFYKLKGEQNQ